MHENITIKPVSMLLPKQCLVDERNALSMSFSFTMTGGSFTITVLKDSVILPPESIAIIMNTVLTMPMGRLGVVKQTGTGYSSGGLTNIISGILLPWVASNNSFVARPQPFTALLKDLAKELLTSLGQGVGVINPPTGAVGALIWRARDYPIKGFSYRGPALSGVQQLAGHILAEVAVNRNQIYVAELGRVVGPVFTVPKSDIISVSQDIDYSQDKKVIIDPSLSQVHWGEQGAFIYDSQHAQKQPQQLVQCGAAGGTDFMPIPDGWMIEGAYEDFTPKSATDPSNPSPTTPRYWKQFTSPLDNNKQRGVMQWTKIVKPLSLPPNVSKFVASPVTGDTSINAGPCTMALYNQGVMNGLHGFSTDDVEIDDAVSGQRKTVRGLVLVPPQGASSGLAHEKFLSQRIEVWTFPKVNPTTIPTLYDPTNPYGLDKDVQVFRPSSSIFPSSLTDLQDFYNYTFEIHKRMIGPRLKTRVSVVYRDALPQPGDGLVVKGVGVEKCGRIESVSLAYGRGGVRIDVSAEVFNYGRPDSHGWNNY